MQLHYGTLCLLWLISYIINFPPQTYFRMSPYFYVFLKQITGHFSWSQCLKTELRSMSWWPRRCLIRECKCLTRFLHVTVCAHSQNSVHSLDSLIRWQRQISQRADVMKAKLHSDILLPQNEWVNLYLTSAWFSSMYRTPCSPWFHYKPSYYICIALGGSTESLL